MYAKNPDHTTATGNPYGRADPVGAGELHQTVAFFATQRPGLFRIALRVTGGDISSAEDVVQEAWLRWQRTDRGQVRNPQAFLTTTTTRLAINVIQSASHRHELPSASLAHGDRDGRHDPAALTDRAAEVAEAVGLLLARLSPVNTRQLVRGARARAAQGVARSVVDRLSPPIDCGWRAARDVWSAWPCSVSCSWPIDSSNEPASGVPQLPQVGAADRGHA